MRVAALYDIHGNLPALEAVTAELREVAPDVVVVGGDVVPGPMPAECLDLLESIPWPTHYVVGNGEVDTLAFRRGEIPARVPEGFHASMRWTAERISDARAEEMADWPLTHSIDLDGLGRVLFCHATPDDENAIFTRVTPDDALASRLEGRGSDLVVCGHTHMQFDRSVGSVRVINAGSVGMPFGEPGAFWLVLDADGPTLRRTAYDLVAADARIEATGYPDAALMRLTEPPPEEMILEAFEAVAIR